MKSPLRLIVALFGAVLVSSCGSDADVTLYCALDQVHAEALIQRFEQETGLTVRAEFDVEANKTVGLVSRLRAESAATRCDVFWNNEIANTVALGDEGLLEPYQSPSAKDIPAQFKDATGLWTGFAARARGLIVNTDLADPAEIHGMLDLIDPKWAGKAGMARPLTGTTLTHATALYSVMGEDAARAFLGTVKRLNDEGKLSLTSGNATLMKQVATGQLAFGFTDTDDFHVALEKGEPVAVVYPDQDGIGTLVIPNSVALIKGGPHPDAAKRLIDFILSKDVERTLAFSRSAQIPVRGSVPRPDYVKSTADFKVMPVDFHVLGKELPARHAELQKLFLD